MKKIILLIILMPIFLFAEKANFKVVGPAKWKKPFKGLELYVHPKNKDITLVIQKYSYKKDFFITKNKLSEYLKDQEQIRSVANATIKIKDWVILKSDFFEHQIPKYQKITTNGVFKDHGQDVKFKEVEYFLGKESVQVNLSYPSSSTITQAEIEEVLSRAVVVK